MTPWVSDTTHTLRPESGSREHWQSHTEIHFPPLQHADMMPFNPEPKNIGLLWAKVRRFCIKSTEVLCKEVRCFCSSEANVFVKREQRPSLLRLCRVAKEEDKVKEEGEAKHEGKANVFDKREQRINLFRLCRA